MTAELLWIIPKLLFPFIFLLIYNVTRIRIILIKIYPGKWPVLIPVCIIWISSFITSENVLRNWKKDFIG